MTEQREPEEKPQRRWWEEGCYCPPDRCVCGTEEDPFRTLEEGGEVSDEHSGRKEELPRRKDQPREHQ